ncbi:GIY-YIG nuclease family protein [Streptomyces sp. NPDC056161]|uniref:GIY-YIG nuclease family protein n=1 Tax=Streptomyces sp. NPDC056161 TaxID=3345732 RepID=UPI0035DD5DF2
MQELTVNCGCGRTMTLDALKGRGAFRCGCGVRIRIAENARASSACQVDGCRTASVTGQKIRLCPDHRDEITVVLAQDIARTDIKSLVQLQERGAGRWEPPVIPVYIGPAVGPTDAATVVREVPGTGRHDPIVYFLRNGDRVKIGTTTNLASRMTALSLRKTNVILALDGGRELEGLLHRRFYSHRIGNTEWFNFADEIKHFVAVRRKPLDA